MPLSNLPTHTSASQLSTYAGCPRRYEMRYVLKLEPAHRGTGLALGTAVHGAVQWFFEERLNVAEPCIEAVLQIFGADLAAELARDDIDWKSMTAESLRVMGERLVRTFLEHAAHLEVVLTEVPFELPIIDPVSGAQLPRNLIGYFDMELKNGNVIELKTAKSSYSEVALVTNLQFAAYRTAARYAGVDVELYALVKNKTPKVQHVVLPHSAEISRWFNAAAAQIERAILAGHFPPAPGMMCSSCEYRRECLGEHGEADAEAEAA